MRISIPRVVFALAAVTGVGAAPPAPVTALAYAPDGKLLAAGGYRDVAFIDPASGDVVATLGGLPGPVTALAYSPDGRRLAIASGAPGKPAELRVDPVTGGRPAPTPAQTLAA